MGTLLSGCRRRVATACAAEPRPEFACRCPFFLGDACDTGRHSRGAGRVTTEATAPWRVNPGLRRFFVRLCKRVRRPMAAKGNAFLHC
jgi:hypothetical protein